MKLDDQQLAQLCHKYGPQLHVPTGVEGDRLLWAMAGKESSFGRNCVPLHERAYCYGGKYYGMDKRLRDLTVQFGCHAHESYGPWQILFYNASRFIATLAPYTLIFDAEMCALLTVQQLNNMIDVQKPPGVREIADAWNSGNWRDSIHPTDYMDAVQGYYLTSTLPSN